MYYLEDNEANTNGFEISAKDVSVGQIIEYNLTGFPKGCTVEVYLLQVRPDIAPGKIVSLWGFLKKLMAQYHHHLGYQRQ